MTIDIKNQDDYQKIYTQNFKFTLRISPGVTSFEMENFVFEGWLLTWVTVLPQIQWLKFSVLMQFDNQDLSEINISMELYLYCLFLYKINYIEF